MNGDLALVKSGTSVICHFGYVLVVAINVESGCQLIVKLCAN